MQNRPVALTLKILREQEVGHLAVQEGRVRHRSVEGLPRLEPPPFFSQGGPQKMILALWFLSRAHTVNPNAGVEVVLGREMLTGEVSPLIKSD